MLRYVLIPVLLAVHCCSGQILDEAKARAYVDAVEPLLEDVNNRYSIAYWNYEANLTDHNSDLLSDVELEYNRIYSEISQNVSQFAFENFTDKALGRRMAHMYTEANGVNETQVQLQSQYRQSMERIYSNSKVCNNPKKSTEQCYPLEPDLLNIMGKSRDVEELLWAWDGWRNASGKRMRETYKKFVDLGNKGAANDGLEDIGHGWRSTYGMKEGEFKKLCARLWDEVKPMYQALHTYAKRKLKKFYGAKHFPKSGHIPAHLLGNMWGQQWDKIFDILKPYPNATAMDVTDELVAQNYTAEGIMRLADDFFASLGMMRVPQSFWDKSILTKPTDGREIVCHASAWDMFDGKDVRIKQCTLITQDWVDTSHHELGHVQYFMQYAHQPVVYRAGANPGFHEAVGDVMSLSVLTPTHMKKIKLVDKVDNAKEAEINQLMRMALVRVAFLPFGYLIDKWRWDVFAGTPMKDFNKQWWKYRPDDAFDAGSKYHVAADVPYIRYFISFVLEFHFHKALCRAANYAGPLHKCDIYNSKEAGKKLSDMLKLGSSKDWPEALEMLTGTRKMTSEPLVEYFEPLMTWLKKENEGEKDNKWDDDCEQWKKQPDDETVSAASSFTLSIALTAIIGILSFLALSRTV